MPARPPYQPRHHRGLVRARRLRAAWAMACVALTSMTQPGMAQPHVRAQEIAQCLPGEIQDWGDGQDRPAAHRSLTFAYDTQSTPSWLDAPTVLEMLHAAAQGWSACGLELRVQAWPAGQAPGAQMVRVQWSATDSRGHFGLANLTARSLSLGPAAFDLLRSRNPAHDARQTLQMVISHEMGHFLGLVAHSRRCVDVTSYYHDGRGARCTIRGGGVMPSGMEYRASLPTACDIARCRAANGVAAESTPRPPR